MAICHDGSEGDGLDRDGLDRGRFGDRGRFFVSFFREKETENRPLSPLCPLSPLSPEAVSEPSPPVAGQVAALF